SKGYPDGQVRSSRSPAGATRLRLSIEAPLRRASRLALAPQQRTDLPDAAQPHAGRPGGGSPRRSRSGACSASAAPDLRAHAEGRPRPRPLARATARPFATGARRDPAASPRPRPRAPRRSRRADRPAAAPLPPADDAPARRQAEAAPG